MTAPTAPGQAARLQAASVQAASVQAASVQAASVHAPPEHAAAAHPAPTHPAVAQPPHTQPAVRCAWCRRAIDEDDVSLTVFRDGVPHATYHELCRPDRRRSGCSGSAC